MARPSLLRPFEDICARHGTLAKISAAFEDEGFKSHPGPDGPPDTRREQFYAYTRGCDLTDPVVEAGLLRVLETILTWVPEVEAIYSSNWRDQDNPELAEHPDRQLVRGHLARHGFALDDHGRILAPSRALVRLPLEQLRDSSAIREHLDRLSAATESDAPLAIGSAKALVEATCKHVLEEMGTPYSDRADVPTLARAVQTALKLQPDQVAPTAKGREAILRTLSNLSQVVSGLAELRNEYAPDHGRTRSSAGIGPRHANLAVGAAQTYCRFLLETLRDRRAAAAAQNRP